MDLFSICNNDLGKKYEWMLYLNVTIEEFIVLFIILSMNDLRRWKNEI